ncbi:MAG: hypothetical protein A2583_07255 [Bdellovibrionales bacterium RIFOXYD1_FULL_53_11]|nr:MAG: hypothetical protein A2583_07255 [Bdellovibrionales bacterium RIFOXYD1_FULL_53_11]
MPLPQKIKSWPAWSNAFAPEIAPSVAGQVDFGAIVALDNCSGSLVRFETSIGTDQAMVLTNGHCLGGGFLPAGTAVSNKPATRSFRLLSRDGKTTLGRLNATRIIYGTMTGTDMALYGLRETFDEIEKKFGTTALTMSSARPKDGRKIAVASGYWKKIYSCSIDRFIFELRESNWTWNDSIRYTQPGCETIGGTSGSPVIDAETREVVGVNNTGNEDGENCTMNNPCEVDANGNTSVHHKASYGQQTFWIYGCLGQGNELQLERPGCKLTK